MHIKYILSKKNDFPLACRSYCCVYFVKLLHKIYDRQILRC
jgi:hypothetical protein